MKTRRTLVECIVIAVIAICMVFAFVPKDSRASFPGWDILGVEFVVNGRTMNIVVDNVTIQVGPSGLEVIDNSHDHTGTTLSGIDISDDTNLSATGPIVLTDDDLSHAVSDGSMHVPSGGTSAQLSQYSAIGTLKWITMSGDASVADGGAVTVADDSHAHDDSTAPGREWSASGNGIEVTPGPGRTFTLELDGTSIEVGVNGIKISESVEIPVDSLLVGTSVEITSDGIIQTDTAKGLTFTVDGTSGAHPGAFVSPGLAAYSGINWDADLAPGAYGAVAAPAFRVNDSSNQPALMVYPVSDGYAGITVDDAFTVKNIGGSEYFTVDSSEVQALLPFSVVAADGGPGLSYDPGTKVMAMRDLDESHVVTIESPNLTGNVALKWPAAVASTAGQPAVDSDAAGQLAFTDLPTLCSVAASTWASSGRTFGIDGQRCTFADTDDGKRYDVARVNGLTVFREMDSAVP